MEILLLKPHEINGKTYEADTVLSIDDADDYCNDLITKGIAKAFDEDDDADDPKPTKTKAKDDKPTNGTGLTADQARDIFKAELDEFRKKTLRRPTSIRVEENEEPNGGWQNLGEFLGDVCKAYAYDMNGQKGPHEPSKRLGKWCKKTVGSDEYRVISNPAGGFLVPDMFQAELLQIAPEVDYIGSRTSKVRMQTGTIKYPRRVDKDHQTSVSGGLTLAWKEETAEITTSQQTFNQLTMTAHELCGAAHVSQKLLRDSPISVVDIITNGFRQQYVRKLINARLTGTGVGQPLGVIGAPCTIDVAKESGQDATTIVAENIIKMWSRCYNYDNAIWIANHNTKPQLATMSISVGTGGSLVWMFQQSLIQGQPPTLYGRPIFFTEYCKTLGTSGDIVLADWGEYLDGVRRDVTASTSMHVRFLNNEETFKVEMEFDGQPLWEVPLTPQEATTDTLSPFVTLATRS